jgi:hypothetical protein
MELLELTVNTSHLSEKTEQCEPQVTGQQTVHAQVYLLREVFFRGAGILRQLQLERLRLRKRLLRRNP